MSWRERQADRRAARALARQLDYQRHKSRSLEGREAEVIAAMTARSRQVQEALERFRPVPRDAAVLEVGSGAHGLIFCFDSEARVGVDPLAAHYARLFPWQGRAQTVAAAGEQLPFAAGAFDFVLCDNVVDHARGPRRIVAEMARVLAPGGLLYFTVNVHHPVWRVFARLHAAWQALGTGLELAPFADHTVHLTPGDARRLFEGQSLRILSDKENAEKIRPSPARSKGGWIKRAFYKNALLEIIALKV